MNLAQLLSRVAQGPVGDIALGGGGTGVLPATSIPLIRAKAQGALTELHERFALVRKTLTLSLIDGRFVYPLLPEHALTSGVVGPDKFIQDSAANPFIGDLLAIEAIYDKDRCELGLNNRNDVVSWYTTAYDTLTMDYPGEGDLYFVEYRADHAVLDDSDPELQKIILPRTLEAALVSKIGYEIYLGQNGESAAIKTQQLKAEYEQACAEVESRNSANNSEIDVLPNRIRQGGWA